MIIISCLILGLANQFVRFLTSFPLFLGLAVLQGMLGGVTHSLMPILIIEFVGLDNLGKGLGFLQLVSGAFVAGFFPLLGYIRDVTGSYVAVYHVIGSGILTADSYDVALVGLSTKMSLPGFRYRFAHYRCCEDLLAADGMKMMFGDRSVGQHFTCGRRNREEADTYPVYTHLMYLGGAGRC
nr:hypothetical protein BaRGS_033657 [Batillaria attramentaria]